MPAIPTSSNLKPLLLSNPPSFSEQLRHNTNQLRSRTVKANYNTKFAQAASELTEFRRATAGLIHEMDDDALCEAFRMTVQFTAYDSYAPFIARFFEKPCTASAIVDLLAPGLPGFLTKSSSTSGGLLKYFPVYVPVTNLTSSDAGSDSWVVSDPLRKRTNACIQWFGVDRMDLMDEDDCTVATIYRTVATVLIMRMHLHLDPEKDHEKMDIFIRGHTAPYATGFIEKWRSFLLIHALFNIVSRTLETVNTSYICTFVDMMRLIDTEFDMVVDCITKGIIPDLDGIADLRQHLESNILPDPERAEELLSIGRPSSVRGWCARVWPKLRSVTSIASGSFASSVPLAQWFLGDIPIHPRGYGSTELRIASPYNPSELNQFKLRNIAFVEFLDISQSDSISSIAQPWEVVPGKRYEVVITNQHGLWRYRLGDVVEISGFDPTDGVPVFQFVERRNTALRLLPCMISEEELRTAMSSLALSILTKIVNWTAAIDERSVPATVGFFVELADDQVPTSDLAQAPDRVFDRLIGLNQMVTWGVDGGMIRKPTIRLVQPGTFSEFLQLKLDEGEVSVGQVKVPVVLPKAEYVEWFVDRVVREL